MRSGPGSPGLLAPMGNGAASDPMCDGTSFGSPGIDGVCPGFPVGLSGFGFGFGFGLTIRGGAGTRSNIDPKPSEMEVCSRFAIWSVGLGTKSVQA